MPGGILKVLWSNTFVIVSHFHASPIFASKETFIGPSLALKNTPRKYGQNGLTYFGDLFIMAVKDT